MLLYTTMVVHQELDLGYLGLFVGLRVNELVGERLRSVEFADARQSHGYVIQHLIEQDRTITELAQRMEVTQQAASKVVAQMISLGILESVVAEDRRAKTIRLSKRACQSVKMARRERRKIESRLVKSIGLRPYSAARRTLLKALEELGGWDGIQSRRIPEPR
jgi:DNA-binding MarR family transcriptional regulator